MTLPNPPITTDIILPPQIMVSLLGKRIILSVSSSHPWYFTVLLEKIQWRSAPPATLRNVSIDGSSWILISKKKKHTWKIFLIGFFYNKRWMYSLWVKNKASSFINQGQSAISLVSFILRNIDIKLLKTAPMLLEDIK